MKRRSLLTAMTLALCCSVAQADSPATEMAPTFSAQTIDGNHFALESYRGQKPVLLKFWATWCSYCVEEMPWLNALNAERKDKLEVLTINVGINDSIGNVEKLFASKGIDLPVVFDNDGTLTQKYGVLGTPTQVLIDRDGKVRMRTYLTTDSFEKAIDELTHEQES